MKYSNIPVAQSIVGHCKVNGINNIIISPGSRNAPLTLSFTENPFFDCFSIVDERCAAFFALGMAQNLQRPVALVCTSGSALLNYYPAIAEAFYSEIPLVVISADRPSYKIDIGDGQTIRQDHVYDRHIGYSANLKQDLIHATGRITRYRPEWLEGKDLKTEQELVDTFNHGELNKAFSIAIQNKLPVHVNVPFEEPLYDLEEMDLMLPDVIPAPMQNPLNLPDEVLNSWNNAEKKMVLVGVNHPNSISKDVLDTLGKDASVLVFTETTSNIHHPNFFNSIDSILAPIELSGSKHILFEDLRPDVLITVGGHVVSKKIKAFLREYTPKYHWHVGATKANDTFFCLGKHFEFSVNDFFGKLYDQNGKKSSPYFEKWNRVKLQYMKGRKSYLNKIPYSDFLVFDKLLHSIPKYYQLQLANSSTIRYTQLFELDPTLQVFCNRGTSGIDGSTSTAMGASVYNESPTLLITGDLSFFYDSNALWNDYVRSDFRIILINNGGAGIFRILPGRKDTEAYERFFETKHALKASHLCEMFHVGYSTADDGNSLEQALEDFYKPSDFPKLLEVHTPRLINNKILTDYFHFISCREY
ncbi:2-succinyl-5-enolpyruvyl-6-hydroxy-3-cyclohexene-1-carboxylic-acid synthase [Maribacter aurantiacus]|uniref:2-succinyl-5-enolpyruvyl-6-hydroxy-3-cyclohexene-1-carboxylate synthase n=1 Tax=Maribacter aurantiacus TaxID=1882343 RepID=A0A5R8M4W7_9FLAO|nr:2-succinyl-5-enolpyruvyl-6-hydroxy-3-cyclohexene-1-carboxylic-acid synthase [Maribacter aurantiacus]TLF44603.1 2-succinyl-5-enolpyruvyl-6-hydroxy-3-cyclohexene-1-carboxylic-acid synthase [Maribacter aurantiacus]